MNSENRSILRSELLCMRLVELLCMRLVAVLQVAASFLLVSDCREVAICGYHLFVLQVLSLSSPKDMWNSIPLFFSCSKVYFSDTGRFLVQFVLSWGLECE